MKLFPESQPTNPNFELTEEDLQDRRDLQQLLSIMERQSAVGITQPTDYADAIFYRDGLKAFQETKIAEGSVALLFDDVIFDFDGVLYDSTYSAYKAVELMLKKRADKNIPVPQTVQEIANVYQAPFQVFYKRFGISLKTPEDMELFKDAYREVARQLDSEHHAPATLYPEAKAVLDTIKQAKKDNPRLRVHIVSAGAERYIKDVLEKHGIAEDFDQIHAECHNKSAMIQAIADSSHSPERTVMIGDLPSDIKDVKHVEGVKSIAVARGAQERARLGMYLPDYIVSDLNELLDLKSYSRELREKAI